LAESAGGGNLVSALTGLHERVSFVARAASSKTALKAAVSSAKIPR